jgi:hypothetical protein
MTTVDQLVSFAERVEEAERQRTPIDWRRLFVALVTLLPYAIGRCAGLMMRAAAWTAAATAEGYRDSRYPQVTVRQPRMAVAQSTMDG